MPPLVFITKNICSDVVGVLIGELSSIIPLRDVAREGGKGGGFAGEIGEGGEGFGHEFAQAFFRAVQAVHRNRRGFLARGVGADGLAELFGGGRFVEQIVGDLEGFAAVEAARERVWILAYYISGGSHPAIQRFYEGMRGKARAGMDVRVISEFGKGTPMPIRNGTLNFAHTLQDDGVAVRFIQEYRVMHKKLLLVDRDKVLLGSSNLTAAGVDGSDEFNVLIASEPFARQAEADFKRLAQRAQLIEKLEY